MKLKNFCKHERISSGSDASETSSSGSCSCAYQPKPDYRKCICKQQRRKYRSRGIACPYLSGENRLQLSWKESRRIGKNLCQLLESNKKVHADGERTGNEMGEHDEAILTACLDVYRSECNGKESNIVTDKHRNENYSFTEDKSVYLSLDDACDNLTSPKLSHDVRGSERAISGVNIPREGTEGSFSETWNIGGKDSRRWSLASDNTHCRICHCSDMQGEPLISPCRCSGSVQHVHERCLSQWMRSRNSTNCELCHTDIQFVRKTNPIWMWQLPSQRPYPVVWMLLFIITFNVNLISVIKDASRRCTSTPCVIFYMVGCTGGLLAAIFTVHFGKQAKLFINQWVATNQKWVVLDKACTKLDLSLEGEEEKREVPVSLCRSSKVVTTV